MSFFSITPGEHYGYRKSRSLGTPVQHIEVIAKAKPGVWKVKFIDEPNAGLTDYGRRKMKAAYLVYLISVVVFACPIIASAQWAQLTRFVSKEISVANYDDNVHGRYFGAFFKDPRMKRLAIVVDNSSNQPIIAAHVRWRWIDASGKPGELMQQHNSLVSSSGFVVNARSTVLILPDGTATPAAQRSGIRGYTRLPQSLLTAPTLTVALDTVILADGEVIGPDKGGLVKELQAQAEAAAEVKEIITAARAQGRDPRPDIDNAAKDTSLASATRRYIVEFAHRGGRRGQIPMPDQIQLPKFYRRHRHGWGLDVWRRGPLRWPCSGLRLTELFCSSLER